MNPPKIKIEIIGEPNGTVNVIGPLQLPDMCIRLLSIAIQIVLNEKQKGHPQPPNVLTPNGNNGVTGLKGN